MKSITRKESLLAFYELRVRDVVVNRSSGATYEVTGAPTHDYVVVRRVYRKKYDDWHYWVRHGPGHRIASRHWVNWEVEEKS